MRHHCNRGHRGGFRHFAGGFGPGEGGEYGFFGGGRCEAGRGGRGGRGPDDPRSGRGPGGPGFGRGPGGPSGGRGPGGPSGGRGPWGFGGGHGGRGPGAMFEHMARMKGGRVLSSDDLQLVILALVEEKPRHGYEIIKALEEKSSGIYKPSPGMIYPALTYLEEADFVKSATEGTKKQLTLTDEGKKHLDENREHVTHVLERLQAYGERMAHFQERMSQEQEAEDQWREMRGDFAEIRDELRQVFSQFASSKEERTRILGILKKALKEIREK